jgi:lantibiotic modifying enzyme
MGCQSLVYLFEHLKRLGIVPEYPAGAISRLLVAEPAVRGHELVDGISGDALLAYFLRRQLAPTQLVAQGEQIKTTMQDMIASWEDRPNEGRIGLALGALGPCLAASKLYGVTKDTELKSLAILLAKLEESVVAKQRPAGWCTGVAGRALAYYHMGRAFDLPGFTRQARSSTGMSVKPAFRNHTLCCGSLGFVAAHLYVRQDSGKYQDRLSRVKTLYKFYESPTRLLTTRGRASVNMPANLFYGLAGLGMVLLCYLDPKNMPAPWAVQ